MSRRAPGHLVPRKDLRGGRSVWYDSPRRAVRTRAPRNTERFEICIAGGGISGAICALVLSTAGHDVAVIDRRSPGEGSTLASTAMIQFEIDTPLQKLSRMIGRKKAARAYLRSAKAVRDLARLIERHKVAAKWIERDALYLAGGEVGFRGLKNEAEARRAIGLPSTFLSKAEVRAHFEIEATGAILSGGSAEIDPAATSAACLRAAQRLGATVISPCELTAIACGDKQVRLSTNSGGVITCRKAIFATGYEVLDGLPRRAFDITSSWAIATKPIAADAFWPGRCLIWEAADPYLYVRSTTDNRILAGGEDSGLASAARRDAAIPAKAETLIRKVRRLLNMPQLEIDYAWAGAFADSPTGLPVFKALPELRGVFAILGCGGNGITFSMIAADMAAAWVRGRRDPDADLFVGT